MSEEFTFDLSLILGIGIVLLVIAYYIKKALTSNVAKSVVDAIGIAGTAVSNTAQNAATGQLTQAQVNDAIEAEAQAIFRAGAGKYTIDQARAIAASDQNALHRIQQNSPPVSFWDLFGLSGQTSPCTAPPSCTATPNPTACGYTGVPGCFS